MNIFILDLDPTTNAQYHVDKHVSKMILEHVQILSSVLHKTNQANGVYKQTHKNHPCTLWAGTSKENFKFLIELTEALGVEFKYRFEKSHKSLEVLEIIKGIDVDLPSSSLTPFAQAMPEEYRSNDAVQAYRKYYNEDKRHLFAWKKRPIPEWIEND